jgi:2-dehydro-3-deoxygluconokinase
MSAIGAGQIVCFGEILLRLSAPGAELLLQTPRFNVCYGGAEANVAVSLAKLGHDARMVSALPDNPLGRSARNELRRHGVDVNGVSFSPGRMGLYFLEQGGVHRASEVTYDRAHSAFAAMDFADKDWAKLLKGAGLLHVSGITAALGPNAANGVLRAVREAREAGVIVSFDCNYREKLWASWRGDAPAILREIVGLADMMFGDHRDVGLMLEKPIAAGRSAADAAFAAFPELKRIAHTRRTQSSVGGHQLEAHMHTRAVEFRAPAMTLCGVIDRIGAGDAFAAGLIHALRRGKGEEAALRFALAAAAVKHSIPGDANLASEEVIEAALAGALDVRR